MAGMYQPSVGLAEATAAWRHVGDLIIGGLHSMDVRQGRMEGDIAVLKTDVAILKTDVAVLKTDVAGLKTDMTEVKAQLTRHELATERGFQRVDAQFERLIGLIQRDETRN